MGRHGIAPVLLFLAAASPLAAQDRPPAPKPQGPQKTVIDAANALSWDEGPVTVTFLTGGVVVQRPDLRLQGGRAMLWKRKDSTEPFDEIYAEGNVIITRGGQKLTCERFFYNDTTRKGAIVDVRLKAYSKDLKADFFAMAKEARINQNRMTADDVALTSCSYGVPHYHLTVRQATLLGAEPEAAPLAEQRKGRYGVAPFGEDWSVDFDELVPEFSGLPFLYVPGLSAGPWLMNFPLRAIRFGHSSQFGNYVYTDFGSRIRFMDENGKLKQWGDVNLKVDWRQVRGWAGGLDTQYKWDGYRGYLDSYYLHDEGRRPGSEFDQQFPPLEHPDRAKVHWFHRQDLDDQWRFELEAYYLSDSSLLQEFFPNEFKELKEPETAAYLRWMSQNMGAFVYARFRLNDFQTEDEYLPRVDFNLLSQPVAPSLLDNLYLTERIDTVDIRREFDTSQDLQSVQTWRVDAVTRADLPFDFRYFQISPFMQNRLTYYQHDLTDEDRVRDVWTAGATASMQFHSTNPDWTWEKVGIRGLRHVVEVRAGYSNNFSNNVDPADLFQYEPVDAITHFEEVSFQVRQRFLTKDPLNKPYEFFNFTVGIEYYPDPGRDTVTTNSNNYTPPFDWIPLAADPNSGVYEKRLWSNLHYDFQFRPRNFFTVNGDGEYNPITHAEEVREVGVTFTPFDGITGALGQTMVKGVTNAISLGLTWNLTPKWAVSVQGQYDFRAGTYLQQEVVIARDFHDFAIEGVYTRDFTRDENRFQVAIVPKFLGKSGLHRSHLYRPTDPNAYQPGQAAAAAMDR